MEISKQPIFFNDASRFICIFYRQEEPARVKRNRELLSAILTQDVGVPSRFLISTPMLVIAVTQEVTMSAREPHKLVEVTLAGRHIPDVIPLDGARNCEPDDDWPPQQQGGTQSPTRYLLRSSPCPPPQRQHKRDCKTNSRRRISETKDGPQKQRSNWRAVCEHHSRSSGLTTQRPGPRGRSIATATPPPGSLQRMVERSRYAAGGRSVMK